MARLNATVSHCKAMATVPGNSRYYAHADLLCQDRYLQALHRMLPFLSSVGHNNYTKSLMIFLAKMAALPESHPHVHRAFENGLHVVRRTDNFWAGIFTDLHIEQVWTIQHHEYYGQLSNNKYSH